MTSFSFVLAYVTLSTRVNPLSVSWGPLLSLLAQSVASSLSSSLSRPHFCLSLSIPLPFPYDTLRLASAILSPPALLAAAVLTPSRGSFVGTRRMGTRDALLQIQMGTYANGVTCYYTFPYTNNVLIGPHTLRAPRTGGPGPPVSPSTSARQVRRGYPIRVRRGNRFIDRLFAASLPPDRSAKLECTNPGWGPFSRESFSSVTFSKENGRCRFANRQVNLFPFSRSFSATAPCYFIFSFLLFILSYIIIIAIILF